MPAKLLTPKQVARAIGVSESTLKRWCDGDRIPVIRTSGGHRRLRQEDVLRLVREGAIPFENPDALGLPPAAGKGEWTQSRAADEVTKALLEGEYQIVQQALLDLFLCGHRVAEIGDTVIAPAMAEIGSQWKDGQVDIYHERRAVGLLTRAIHELQRLVPRPAMDAPIAMGGTASGDVYTLPTLMVELVLREAGWRATSLGGPLPFDSLREAMLEHAPRIFWLSVSEVTQPESFVSEYTRFFESCPAATAIVIGGRALDPCMRSKMRFASCCEDLRHLVDFANALQPVTKLKIKRQSDSA